MLILPIPTQDLVQPIATTASSLGDNIATVFKVFGYDPRTLIAEPSFIAIENIINHWVDKQGLNKGLVTVITAWVLGILIEVAAGLALGWDIKSAIITGIFIGFQASIYHDFTK